MDCSGTPLVAISFVTALIAELAGAALGFGPAVLYEISWQLCAVLGLSTGVLETAVWNIVIEDAPCGLLQLYLLRKHFRPKLFALFNAPVLLTLPVGTFLLLRFGHSDGAKNVLGIIFLGIVGLQIWMQRRGPEPPTKRLEDQSRPVVIAVVAAMGSAGLLRGSLGVAGPPVMVLLLFIQADRGVWRCLANTTRVTMIFVQGLILGFNNELSLDCWPLYVALMTGGLAGLGIGNMLARHVDQATFQRWLLLFLIAGALLMLCSGVEWLSAVAASFVVLAGVLVALAPLLPAHGCLVCGQLLPLWKSRAELYEAARTPMVEKAAASDNTNAPDEDL
mmetsp:Transcript_477/g.1424  ORF Transcript_477/g.1424 Transcript_477/m.1424 type:complete len:335 (-) Transcript_477:73-1077(-)